MAEPPVLGGPVAILMLVRLNVQPRFLVPSLPFLLQVALHGLAVDSLPLGELTGLALLLRTRRLG